MSDKKHINLLYHFPQLYKGDCFYDVLARYHSDSAHLTNKATSLELFGSCPDLRPSVTLPYHADRIYSWLGAESNISSENLRDYHSAWQYLQLDAKFSLSALSPIIKADIMPGRRKQAKMMAALQGDLSHLRYCPMCLIADQLAVSEPYWHQVHQIFGVKYCPIHKVPLLESPVSIERRLVRYITLSELFTVPMSECHEDLMDENNSDPFRKQYQNLANTIYWLLRYGKTLGTHQELLSRYCHAMGLEENCLSGDDLYNLLASVLGMAFLRDLFPHCACDTFLNTIRLCGEECLTPIGHALVVMALTVEAIISL